MGGTLRATADGIEVDGASEVILLLCGGTSFDEFGAARTSGDAAQLADRVKGIVDAAAAKSWDELLNAHVANFTSFMGRVDFQITPNPSKKNTEDLVKFYSGSQNNKNSADGLFSRNFTSTTDAISRFPPAAVHNMCPTTCKVSGTTAHMRLGIPTCTPISMCK